MSTDADAAPIERNSHGGHRPGAGRRPKALVAFEVGVPEVRGHAARAYKLLTDVMDDPEKPIALRVSCAIEVLDRLAGKAR